MRNSNTNVARTTSSAASGSRCGEPGLDVYELGGDASDLGVERRRRVAELCNEFGCFATLRGAGGRDVDNGDGCRGVGPDGRSDNAGCRGELVEPGDELGAVDIRVGDDGDGIGAACGEPVGKGQGHRSNFGRAGQGAGVTDLEAGTEERHTEQDQDDHGDAADGDGMALHPTGESVEAAVDVSDRSRRRDLGADGGEGGGQQRDRGRHAEQHDAEAGDAERGEDRHAEHEQAAHRDGDGEGGEHHGPACGRDGLCDSVVDSASAAALLAEPVDHQQAVVDAEADAEHVDDVDREDRHVTEHGRADEHGERRDDTGEGDEERHARGAQSAEQEDQGDERDRQRDRFAPEEILFGRGAELFPDEHVAADEHLGGVEVASDIGDLVGELDFGLLVESAGDGDHGERGATVGGAQGVGAGRPWVGDGDHTVDGGDAFESVAQGARGRGIIDVDAVGDDRDLAAGLGEVVEPLGDAARFGAGSGTETGGEHREGRASDGAGPDQEHDPQCDDRTTAADDERTERGHYEATFGVVVAARPTERSGVAWARYQLTVLATMSFQLVVWPPNALRNAKSSTTNGASNW